MTIMDCLSTKVTEKLIVMGSYLPLIGPHASGSNYLSRTRFVVCQDTSQSSQPERYFSKSRQLELKNSLIDPPEGNNNSNECFSFNFTTGFSSQYHFAGHLGGIRFFVN